MDSASKLLSTSASSSVASSACGSDTVSSGKAGIAVGSASASAGSADGRTGSAARALLAAAAAGSGTCPFRPAERDADPRLLGRSAGNICVRPGTPRRAALVLRGQAPAGMSGHKAGAGGRRSPLGRHGGPPAVATARHRHEVACCLQPAQRPPGGLTPHSLMCVTDDATCRSACARRRGGRRARPARLRPCCCGLRSIVRCDAAAAAARQF